MTCLLVPWVFTVICKISMFNNSIHLKTETTGLNLTKKLVNRPPMWYSPREFGEQDANVILFLHICFVDKKHTQYTFENMTWNLTIYFRKIISFNDMWWSFTALFSAIFPCTRAILHGIFTCYYNINKRIR